MRGDRNTFAAVSLLAALGGFLLSATSCVVSRSVPEPPPAPGPYTLHYSTFLGGSRFDRTAGDQVTDPQGNLYVVGNTMSPDFPATPGAFDTTYSDTGGSSDAFVAKFSASGRLLWATFLGGPSRDELYGVQVDSQGYVYVAGAFGPNAPATPGAVQPSFAGGSGQAPWDGFMAKLTPDGSRVVWATYLGTKEENDCLRSLAIDAEGNAIVGTGYQGGLWPSEWFTNGYQQAPQGGDDTVIIKVRSDGAQVLWATYLGGAGDEQAQPAIAVDSRANVHVLATTNSTNMPATPGAHDHTHNGQDDAYVAKLSADGRTLLMGTYLGGANNDGTGGKSPITVDGEGNIIFTVWTRSSNFPTTAGAAHPSIVELTSWGTTTAVAKLSPTGALLASSYTGYSASTETVAFDAAGNIYTVGETTKSNRAVTADAYQRALAGSTDAYVEVFSGDLTRIVYASYLGGRGKDFARMAWVDNVNNRFYVFGNTNAAGFPTHNAWQPLFKGAEDIFITAFNISPSPAAPTLAPKSSP